MTIDISKFNEDEISSSSFSMISHLLPADTE